MRRGDLAAPRRSIATHPCHPSCSLEEGIRLKRPEQKRAGDLRGARRPRVPDFDSRARARGALEPREGGRLDPLPPSFVVLDQRPHCDVTCCR
ncbi:hypothetical protein DB32_004210 [Sandaracinus amylolyticus]|uniref:Uncharacterized protein n=1 Tax=Sandaracinus amylolyticus TaxID=927083 RepID=A0A0F6W4B1_9BACT|nr:hypothetical protein DB32_004210 [Sandaracinus amylolyticus]